MNFATFIALLVLLAMLIPAIIYLYKNGTCGSCPDKGSCSGKCESEKKLKELMSDPQFEEKNSKIDEIITKHNSK